MSKAAIQALKRIMPTIDERKKFVDNCVSQDPNWEKWIDGECISAHGLFRAELTFLWMSSQEGSGYWSKIVGRLTLEETKIKINLKEL